MELKFTVQAKIQKPVAEVFDAVRDPAKLSKYFTTGGATDRSRRERPRSGDSLISPESGPCE